MSGVYDRYPFYDLPPYSTVAVGNKLGVPSNLGYYMSHHSPVYYANHYVGLSEKANAEFRDSWDTNSRPLLRNTLHQIADIKDGQQVLVSYYREDSNVENEFSITMVPDPKPAASEPEPVNGKKPKTKKRKEVEKPVPEPVPDDIASKKSKNKTDARSKKGMLFFYVLSSLCLI